MYYICFKCDKVELIIPIFISPHFQQCMANIKPLRLDRCDTDMYLLIFFSAQIATR